MKQEVRGVIVGAVMVVMAAVWALVFPMMAVAEGSHSAAAAVEKQTISWTDYTDLMGNCKMKFPAEPEHISEKMSVPEEGFDMNYDAYISAVDQETMFMLLVAQYPDFVNEEYAQMSLEAFLNGILTNNPDNQLIFADLSLVAGHEALDFFIRQGSVYFKGRAIMVKNSLYLMAMECEMKTYDEAHFNTFINSFEINAIKK